MYLNIRMLLTVSIYLLIYITVRVPWLPKIRCVEHSNISTVIFVATDNNTDNILISYLLIGLRNQAGDAAVSIQKLLKLLLTDDEPLCLSQGALSCIFPINQQTLKHLNTGSTDRESDYVCQNVIYTQTL